MVSKMEFSENSADEIKEENLAYFFLAVFLLQA